VDGHPAIASAACAQRRSRTRGALDLTLNQGRDLELNLFAMLKPSDDAQEAASAFREKRAPNFTGH
jgi:enoyl-CoA hydratase